MRRQRLRHTMSVWLAALWLGSGIPAVGSEPCDGAVHSLRALEQDLVEFRTRFGVCAGPSISVSELLSQLGRSDTRREDPWSRGYRFRAGPDGCAEPYSMGSDGIPSTADDLSLSTIPAACPRYIGCVRL